MVNHGGNMLEKPLVGAVSYPVYVLILRAHEVGPAIGDDGAGASNVDSIEDNANHPFRVV